MRAIFLSLLLVFPVVATAQGAMELTPTIGMRWGGELDIGYLEDYGDTVSVDGGPSYGLMFDVDLNRWLFLELMLDHQSTDLGSGRNFQPPAYMAGVDIDYYHIGLGWQWHARNLRPYVIGSIGWTNIDPELPDLRDEDLFSASLGGGLKMDINEHIGFRLELRTFWTDTSDGRWWDDSGWWEDDCNHTIVMIIGTVSIILLKPSSKSA